MNKTGTNWCPLVGEYCKHITVDGPFQVNNPVQFQFRSVCQYKLIKSLYFSGYSVTI